MKKQTFKSFFTYLSSASVAQRQSDRLVSGRSRVQIPPEASIPMFINFFTHKLIMVAARSTTLSRDRVLDINPTMRAFLARNKSVVEKKRSFLSKSLFHQRRISSSKKQEPNLLVITSTDSRVPVEEIFAAYPGEMSVIRQFGFVLGREGLASVYYNLTRRPIDTVLVMGLSKCSALEFISNLLLSEHPIPRYLHPIAGGITSSITESRINHAYKDDSDVLLEAAMRNAIRVASSVYEVLTHIRLNEGAFLKDRDVKIYNGVYFPESGYVRLFTNNLSFVDEKGKEIEITPKGHII